MIEGCVAFFIISVIPVLMVGAFFLVATVFGNINPIESHAASAIFFAGLCVTMPITLYTISMLRVKISVMRGKYPRHPDSWTERSWNRILAFAILDGVIIMMFLIQIFIVLSKSR